MATAKSAALSDLDLAINSGNERALIFAINEAAPFISEEARLLAYKRWRDLVQDVKVDEHFGEMELIQPLLGLEFAEFVEFTTSKNGARSNFK